MLTHPTSVVAVWGVTMRALEVIPLPSGGFEYHRSDVDAPASPHNSERTSGPRPSKPPYSRRGPLVSGELSVYRRHLLIGELGGKPVLRNLTALR